MSESKSSGGIGFLEMLTILFIGLKLGNVIDWSWWWVLAAIWIPYAITVVCFVIVYLKVKGQ